NVYFFFSSRRRHTRFSRDWSSDVCSSDLAPLVFYLNIDKTPAELSLILTDIGLEVEAVEKVESIPGGLEGLVVGEVLSAEQHPRSEERRVGKECRSRRSSFQEQNNNIVTY